jgi:tetratricopeptide (TPR) repeat protein
LDLAKELLDHALNIRLRISESKTSVSIACTRAGLAYYHQLKQALDTAKKIYIEAVEIVKSIHGSWKIKETAWIAFQLAEVLSRQCQYLECETFCGQVLQGLDELYGDEVNHHVANAKLLLGFVLIEQGKHMKAIPLLKQAQSAYEKLNDRYRLVQAKFNMAYILYYNAKYEHALKTSKECLKELFEIFKTRRNSDFASVLARIGVVYCALGQYQRAYVYSRESLEVKIAIRGTAFSSDIAMTMTNVSQYLRILDDIDGCMRLTYDAERILAKIKMIDSSLMGTLFLRRAFAYSESGMYPEALDCCLKSMAIFRKTLGNETNPEHFAALRLRGSIQRLVGQLTESRNDLEPCLEMEEKYYKTRKNNRFASTLIELGALNRVERKFDEALSQLVEARDILKEVLGKWDSREKASVLYELGLLFKDMGKVEEAKVELEHAAAMLKRMFGNENHRRLKLVKEALSTL